MPAARFRINVYQRVMLAFLPLFLLVMLGINLWTSLHLRNLSKWETVLFPAVIIALTALAIHHLFRWFNFTVELSDQGIRISGEHLRWEDLDSVQAKLATQFSSFSTLIELRSRDGRAYKIPACIQKNGFLLREIQKHLPDIR